MNECIFKDSVEPEYYPNTNTFINLLDITDHKKLRSKESDFSLIRSLELLLNPNIINKSFDFAHLKKIHHHLFQDIYTWAGKPRSFNMAKNGDIFTPAKELPQYEDKVFSTALHLLKISSPKNKTHIAKGLAHSIGIINAYHPFPEGNGRAQRVFTSLLAKELNYDINWKAAAAWEMVETFKASHGGNYIPLEKLMQRIIIEPKFKSIE